MNKFVTYHEGSGLPWHLRTATGKCNIRYVQAAVRHIEFYFACVAWRFCRALLSGSQGGGSETGRSFSRGFAAQQCAQQNRHSTKAKFLLAVIMQMSKKGVVVFESCRKCVSQTWSLCTAGCILRRSACCHDLMMKKWVKNKTKQGATKFWAAIYDDRWPQTGKRLQLRVTASLKSCFKQSKDVTIFIA